MIVPVELELAAPVAASAAAKPAASQLAKQPVVAGAKAPAAPASGLRQKADAAANATLAALLPHLMVEFAGSPDAVRANAAAFGELAAEFFGHLIARILRLGARGAKNRHCLGQLSQRIEAGDEFTLDAQHAPRIGMLPFVVRAGFQQALVKGGALFSLAAQQERAAQGTHVVRGHFYPFK